jgi:predicted DNA-binding mobile mystery protein A
MPKLRRPHLSSRLRRLQLKQLEARLQLWKRVREDPSPAQGWVAAIRETLGMSVGQLASRMGITPAAVVQLEHREVEGRVTLESLRKAADAMDCDVVYALVPRTSLWNTLERQAEAVAREEVQRVGHTMGLEGQRSAEEEEARQEAELRQQLLAELPRRLWGSYRRSDPDARGTE